MTTPEIRAQFQPAPGMTYLDAATYGLPPLATIAALDRALKRWQSGEADYVAEWENDAAISRGLFAELIGARKDDIALIPTVSVGIGVIAASLPEGAHVIVPTMEFTSVLFPLLVAEQARGVEVEQVPFTELANSIRSDTHLVAFSLTRSQSGETADLAAICQAARQHGTQVLVDATHAIPFVPVEEHLPDIDYLICHGYKHLLCPRGASFFYVREDRWDELYPYDASWKAASPEVRRHYGGSLTLAPNAARFDVSLAWHSWVGARQSLQLLVEWKKAGQLAPVLDLAAQLAKGLGLQPPTSSIVTFSVPDAEAAEAAIARAGVKCASRGGNIRLSPHVYNTPEDISRAIEAVAPLMLAVR